MPSVDDEAKSWIVETLSVIVLRSVTVWCVS
jgi:hypothetical protein